MTKPDPHSVWLLVDAVAVLFARSYMLARTRAVSHVSPMVRMLALRDHAHSEAALLAYRSNTQPTSETAGLQGFPGPEEMLSGHEIWGPVSWPHESGTPDTGHTDRRVAQRTAAASHRVPPRGELRLAGAAGR